ncbi:spore gernimation protein GerPD [Heyndrickxia acidicola]|uniref:Spore gernimation protein GerPD n=1 Tax=Heyndrickxia acidicola TaxID=209389 RepID=A0ABU6MDH0_9BACI|nr:spore gernimation protein GerPD [Heyndrickxia acidicola]MED1202479.1 spore gernimation protein GerPD [Heyndrickxia acidicola]
MEINFINRELCVGEINVIGVSSSSLFLIGDADTIQQAATFDTPAESLIIGPFVPFTPR